MQAGKIVPSRYASGLGTPERPQAQTILLRKVAVTGEAVSGETRGVGRQIASGSINPSRHLFASLSPTSTWVGRSVWEVGQRTWSAPRTSSSTWGTHL